jgi:hypothetical protein
MTNMVCIAPTPTPERSPTMAKPPANHGKRWTSEDVKQLKQLAKENTPTRVIGLKMGRTEDSVRAKADENNVSLKPTNQSPYNRRKP